MPWSDTQPGVQRFIETGRSPITWWVALPTTVGPADDSFGGAFEGIPCALVNQVDGHHHGYSQCDACYGQAQLPWMAQEKMPA